MFPADFYTHTSPTTVPTTTSISESVYVSVTDMLGFNGVSMQFDITVCNNEVLAAVNTGTEQISFVQGATDVTINISTTL